MSTITRPREAVLDAVPGGLFIGGQWRPALEGNTFDVHDPATGEVIATIADARTEDAMAALDAAHAAQASWRRTPPGTRADILRRAFEEVHRRRDEFARLMTLQIGRPLAEAHSGINYGADLLRWFAQE